MPHNDAYTAKFQGPKGQEDMPYLLTPGPVTTSRAVKLAMLVDYAPHDAEFISLVAFVQNEVLRLAHASDRHDCVLMQGPGMFAVEAALGSFSPQRRKKTLVLANGKHGQLAHQILTRLGRPNVLLERDQTTPFTPGDVDTALSADPDITHVWSVHCEASSGIVNPIVDIAALVKAKNKVMMVDAIASFGGIPLAMTSGFDVLVSTAGNCLESVPGISFVIADKNMLLASEGKSHSMVFDLFANWQTMSDNGQFRFTPSPHAIVALAEALRTLEQSGGIASRHQRYVATSNALTTRMKAMGMQPVLSDAHSGTLVHSFFAPRDSNYNFATFAKALRQRGFVIMPGALSTQESFRVALQGQIDEALIEKFAAAVIDVLQLQDIRELRPR